MDGHPCPWRIVHDRCSRRPVIRVLGLEIGAALRARTRSRHHASPNSRARLCGKLFPRWSLARMGRFKRIRVCVTDSTQRRDLLGGRAGRHAAVESKGRRPDLPRRSALLSRTGQYSRRIPSGQTATARRRTVPVDIRMELRHCARWATARAPEQSGATSRNAWSFHRFRQRAGSHVIALGECQIRA